MNGVKILTGFAYRMAKWQPIQKWIAPLLSAMTFLIPGSRLRETENLLAFYHPDTLRQLCSLRVWLLERRAGGAL